MWYYTLNNQQVGPVDEAQIKTLIASGTITAATLVWTSGMANWQPISQTTLASLVGSIPPPVGAYVPATVYEAPEVTCIKKLFMWFWISLIAAIPTFGATTIASSILFFIIIWKAWKLVQHEGIRATPDQVVAYCMIPGWNFYWYFPAFVGLVREINARMDKENIMAERLDTDLPTWMNICLYLSWTGIGAIAYLVLWIIYTSKIKNAAIALIQAEK